MALPLLVIGAIAGYATGAGCYAWTMNCFSITVAHDWLDRVVLFGARLLPYLAPAYIAVFLAGLAAIWRLGEQGARLWLVLAPPGLVLALRASCLVLAPWVMAERRVTPDLSLDLAVLGCGVAYTAAAWFAIDHMRLLRPRTSPWQQRELSRPPQA